MEYYVVVFSGVGEAGEVLACLGEGIRWIGNVAMRNWDGRALGVLSEYNAMVMSP